MCFNRPNMSPNTAKTCTYCEINKAKHVVRGVEGRIIGWTYKHKNPVKDIE